MFHTLLSAKSRPGIRVQLAAAAAAIAGAVALPQIFHVLGALFGLGTALGAALLPMHLPVILAGLLVGPCAGAVSGLLAPLVSFGLSSMPSASLLPFMMVELCAYGLLAGLLRSTNLSAFRKVLLVQVGGRVVRSAAILISVFALGNATLSVSVIWTSISAGALGIVLQWALLPLIVSCVERCKNHAQ